MRKDFNSFIRSFILPASFGRGWFRLSFQCVGVGVLPCRVLFAVEGERPRPFFSLVLLS